MGICISCEDEQTPYKWFLAQIRQVFSIDVVLGVQVLAGKMKLKIIKGVTRKLL